jgi:tetratricopeptide (TPR) repeat protein
VQQPGSQRLVNDGVAVLLHRDVVAWLEDPATKTVRGRLLHDLLDLAARGRTRRVKPVHGVNRGWLRSPLCGDGGSHFYVWWRELDRPRDSSLPGAVRAGKSVIVRAVRHHDETDRPLPAGDPAADYSAWVPARQNLGDLLTPAQRPVVESPGAVMLVRGSPGTGKTTALLQFLLQSSSGRSVYLTKNQRLASQAAELFRASGLPAEQVTIEPIDSFIDRLAGASAPRAAERALIRRFLQEVARYPRALGRFRAAPYRLYAEIYAHILGRSLPFQFRGRPPASSVVADPDAYLSSREPVLGPGLARAALGAASHLHAVGLVDELFPALSRAWLALRSITDSPSAASDDHATVVVDEVQDLTPLEASVVLKFSATRGTRVIGAEACRVVVAGDEGQTVKPSDFDWGELADLSSLLLSRPTWVDLGDDLRSSEAVAEVVERSWGLYRHLEKAHRPRGKVAAGGVPRTPGAALLVRCTTEDQLASVLAAATRSADAILIYPGDEVPTHLEALAGGAESILASREVKGLDFDTVVVLQAGAHLIEYRSEILDPARDTTASMLTVRMMADQLRVAFSRATERLVLVELDPDGEPTHELETLIGPRVGSVSPEAFVDEMAADHCSPDEHMGTLSDEIEKLVETHPERCFRRAAGLLDRLALQPSSVEPEAHGALLRLASAAAIHSIAQGADSVSGPDQGVRLERAATWLEEGGHHVEAGLVRRLLADRSTTTVPSEDLASVHPQVRVAIERWMAATLAREPAPGQAAHPGRPTAARAGVEADSWNEWRAALEEADRFQDVGDFRRAEKLYRKIVNIAREIAPRDTRVGLSLGRLGAAQAGRGFWAQATDTLKKSLDLLDAASAPDSLEFIGILSNLGSSCRELNRNEEAERHLRRAVHMQKRLQPPEDPDRLHNLVMLAHLLGSRFEFDEALQLLDLVIKFGPGEADDLVATALKQRMAIRQRLGDLSGAAADRAAIEGLGGTLGEKERRAHLADLPTSELIQKAATGKTLESDDACVLLVQRGAKVVDEVLAYMRSNIEASGSGAEEDSDLGDVAADRPRDSRKSLIPLQIVLANVARSAWGPVRAMIKDPNEAMRVEMVKTLGAIAVSVPEAVPDVIAALHDPAVKVRTMAAHRLGMLKDPGDDVIASLRAVVAGSDDEPVQLNSAIALATLRREMDIVLPFVEESLRHPDRGMRTFGLVAVEKAGEAALPLADAVAENLHHPDRMIRRLAMIALVTMGGPKADIAARVSPLTSDADEEIRDLARKLMTILER